MPPGCTLLLCTDGIIGVPSHTLDEGLDRLRQHAAALAHRPLQSFAGQLLHRVQSPGPDDVALLPLCVPGRAPCGHGERLSGNPAAVLLRRAEETMTTTPEGHSHNRFCKACGTPAGDGPLCEHCGSVVALPDDAGLTEDQGAAVRRDFEERDAQRSQ